MLKSHHHLESFREGDRVPLAESLILTPEDDHEPLPAQILRKVSLVFD